MDYLYESIEEQAEQNRKHRIKNQILEITKTVLNDHYFIIESGYGELSDDITRFINFLHKEFDEGQPFSLEVFELIILSLENKLIYNFQDKEELAKCIADFAKSLSENLTK
ncbi:hypothetical protein [Anaerococcus lactolyticus]|uniref:hypothetical protein n=1 Tax=Anaerococcus lactolyticus TaxID=33032 RepID=UPI0023F21FF6|nr:hypothetical protein [Anaerococcus lactolyticus]